MKFASLVTLIAIFAYLVLSTAQAMAVSPADFPSCSNPQGSLLASYDSGTHGIVGNTATFTGSDKVYWIDDQKVTQCFCPLDGKGIQTNWIKANSLSQDEIKVHERDGWIYIASGKTWGLEDVAYLAKNHDFSCPGSSNGSSGSQSGGGSSNGTSSGIVEASSAVLGLAGTGNTITLLYIASTGLVAFFLSFLLKRQNNS